MQTTRHGRVWRRGFVSLVGAGPGDPDLLTRRAAQRLDTADLVLYDALVDPAVLTLAPRARSLFVGKRAGRPSVSQKFINRLMIRAAWRGQVVVRLKGGDPFVFGRGGEEALALAAAGVPFEVVPGVSSAIAAAGLANIPLTHRGVASGFLVVSGHAEEAYAPVLNTVAPGSVTLVVLMGFRESRRIAAILIDRGWSRETPAAVVSGASTQAEAVSIVTLMQLRDSEAPDPRAAGPGVIVVGNVVRLRAVLSMAGTLHDRAERPAGQAAAR